MYDTEKSGFITQELLERILKLQGIPLAEEDMKIFQKMANSFEKKQRSTDDDLVAKGNKVKMIDYRGTKINISKFHGLFS